ncbi:MAG: imidazole glycerol phosphate synthase subunit HisH [Gemmataceae bacterium]
MIAIVDYGMANLRSVQKAFETVGQAAEITADPQRVAEASHVVLPGVGAFCDAIAKLRETGLDAPILNHLRADRPFLGICLGLQMLFDRSTEDGVFDGLGWFAGDVVRFADVPELKVPHMGWNRLHLAQSACSLFRGVPEGAAVYFVHSYYAVPKDSAIIAATADYREPFTAAICRGRTVATQFHPEKSQAVGLQMLRNFATLT